MFRVPESGPRIALRAETMMIYMKHKIWQRKLLLLKKNKKIRDKQTLWPKVGQAYLNK